MTTATKKKTLAASDLTQFCGTINYWRHSNGIYPFLHTDGVQYVAQYGGAYWLLDVIASWQVDTIVKTDAKLKEIQFWTLTVQKDNSAMLHCERDTDDVVVSQRIEYTDFPIPEIRFYLVNMWCYWEYEQKCQPRIIHDYGVLMLPSEY